MCILNFNLRLILFFLVVVMLGTTTAFSQSNKVIVSNVNEFPEADKDGEITLNAFKVYMVEGMIDLGDKYINLNGATLVGTGPGKDGIISKVDGAVLRSEGEMVYLESIAVICAGAKTMAYDFSDKKGKKYLNLFAGCSVLEAGTSSMGVGKIEGFNTVCIDLNYWNCAKGMDISGDLQKFTFTLNYVTGIQEDAALEFKNFSTLEDIVLTSNYFVYKGKYGVHVHPGAQVDQGRLSLNLFRGPEQYLKGFNSSSPSWQMLGNGVGVPDTKAEGYIYMTGNTIKTDFPDQGFSKVSGNTMPLISNKFENVGNNRLKYIGKQTVSVNVDAMVSGVSRGYKSSYTLSLVKNGSQMITPKSTVNNVPPGQGFQIYLITQVKLERGDFVELHIRSNNNPDLDPIIVNDLMLKLFE